jgi:hypothetical protein
MQYLSRLTGILPFSVGEIFVLVHAAALLAVTVLWVFKLFRGGAGQLFYRAVVYISGLYVVFMAIWGLNYSRLPLSELMKLEIRPYSHEELYSLTEALIFKANEERKIQEVNSAGVMRIRSDFQDVFERTQEGYDLLSTRFKIFEGLWGKPKPIQLSKLMLYTGITGIFMPYTGEANVNIAVPDLLLPAVAMHEKAHQMGIAPEDEANYMAYLSCSVHPDSDFRYSGTILALIYSLNALNRESPDDVAILKTLYSEDLRMDLAAYAAFWKPYEGKVNNTADKVNDTYLKTNRQEDGVKSYGRMVDLLLADFMARGTL